MAHRKAGGSADNLKDSKSKRLGVKLFGGQDVRKGNILVRQRGTKWGSGDGTAVGKDHTIFAMKDGKVSFKEKRSVAFTGKGKKKVMVQVLEK